MGAPAPARGSRCLRRDGSHERCLVPRRPADRARGKSLSLSSEAAAGFTGFVQGRVSVDLAVQGTGKRRLLGSAGQSRDTGGVKNEVPSLILLL